MRLTPIATDVWIADGPDVSFMGFPYPTRMGLVRMPSGGLWVWSPVALDDTLADEIDALGEVRQLVEPNKLHHLALAEWQSRWPSAQTHAPPGLASRRSDLPFSSALGDTPPAGFEGVIEQVVVRGSFAMEEVLFSHRPSRTLFVGDLVRRHDADAFQGWQRWMMRLDGLVGPDGSTPREWRATFLHRERARDAVDRAVSWGDERMVVAHGEWVPEGGAAALREALSWLY